MTRRMSVRTEAKACRRCGTAFGRGGLTLKQFDHQRVCPGCEPAELRDRILRNKTVDANGCWIWTLSVGNQHGHGQIRVHDEKRFAHRIAYEVFVGCIPAGRMVCHQCDVPLCVNPDHLYLGDAASNIRDAVVRGRMKKPPVHYGLMNANATLTEAQVAEVRRLRAQGVSQRAVAARFKCSQSTVWRITHRITRAS